MTTSLNESTLETTALEWLEDLGYSILHGPDIAPGERGQERGSFEVVRLRGTR